MLHLTVSIRLSPQRCHTGLLHCMIQASHPNPFPQSAHAALPRLALADAATISTSFYCSACQHAGFAESPITNLPSAPLQYGEDAIKEGMGSGGGGGGGMGDIFDILSGGGRRQQPRERRGENVVHRLKVSLEEMYSGGVRKLSLSRNIKCDTCGGSGTKSGKRYQCEVCSLHQQACNHHMLAAAWPCLSKLGIFVSCNTSLMHSTKHTCNFACLPVMPRFVASSAADTASVPDTASRRRLVCDSLWFILLKLKFCFHGIVEHRLCCRCATAQEFK